MKIPINHLKNYMRYFQNSKTYLKLPRVFLQTKMNLLGTCLILALPLQAQVSEPLPFMSHFTPKQAVVTDYSYKDTIPSHFGLVRLPNGKITCMTRQQGSMQPFFIRAIETGYWDTRYDPSTNYDSVFADMRQIGANTAYVMLHWEDIEPADNMFDFSFADSIADAAERQGLKLQWILFLHAQKNGVPSHHCETAWTFHLDDRDSCNYTMQWPSRHGEVYKDIKTLIDKGGIRPLHVYGHPAIFTRIRRMLYNLAIHYRDSKTVIGVQLGNEEGFSFLDQSDNNPITAALFREWQSLTNKTDYAQFKKEAINWWWKQFTSAYHEGDPYKILSLNLDAGQAEAGDLERINMTGTSAATYANGNLDAIGTMLYKQWGYKALLGLDTQYNEGSYNYALPILVPSEIGIGNFNTPHHFTSFVLHTLERAAQGFGVYCYGEVRKEIADSTKKSSDQQAARHTLINMFQAIRENEDIIHAGLPGYGLVKCTVKENRLFHVSHLQKDNKETLALIYHSPFLSKEDSVSSSRTDLSLQLECKEAGNYLLKIHRLGQQTVNQTLKMKNKQTIPFTLKDVSPEDVLFIRITKQK